jgi:hypothetical protein
MGMDAEEKVERQKGKASVLLVTFVVLLVILVAKGRDYTKGAAVANAVGAPIVGPLTSAAPKMEAKADQDPDLPTYTSDGFWNASIRCNQKTLLTACSCQEVRVALSVPRVNFASLTAPSPASSLLQVSDYFGMWHYRSFLDASEEVQTWWIEHKPRKCEQSPQHGTRGWRC